MTRDLHAFAAGSVTRAQRVNHAFVNRLLGILDLEPPLKVEAIHAAIDEELADQRECALARLGPLCSDPGEADGARSACRLLERPERGFPETELSALVADAGPRTREALDEVLGRYRRFEVRLGWLLRPSTVEEIEGLDPREHSGRIYHHISYEFRLEQKLFAVIFELAASMIPYSALMFSSTGEFTLRAFKRINDTVMFFSNMIEWGLESKRGRDAVARVNTIHGRYSLPGELFRFILSGIMFLPLTWNERLGWRKFTRNEQLGWFHAFAEMGCAMNIPGVTHDFEEMQAWWRQMLARAGETSVVGATMFQKIVIQVLATYPADLRKPLLASVICGMPDEYRQCLDIPPPPEDWVEGVRNALLLVGLATDALPRVPWIRSLQVYPSYKTADSFGVGARSRYMPRPGGRPPAEPGTPLADNEGLPAEQHPIPRADAVPALDLPEISLDELARHDRDGDAWIGVGEFVYDVTRFLYEHPGGRDVLAPHLGKVGTAEFLRVGHSQGALIMMSNFRVGRLAPSAVVAVEPDARERGRKIHTGRRVGAGKRYAPEDWDDLLDHVVEQTALYELAKRDPDRDPEQFPIQLPGDPRPVRD